MTTSFGCGDGDLPLEGAAERQVLDNQKSAIQKAIGKLPQLALPLSPTDPKARDQIRQIEKDRQSMEDRLLAIDRAGGHLGPLPCGAHPAGASGDGVSVAGGAGVGGACVSEKTRQGHQGRQGQEIRYQPPSLCP
jgi:hypothetical protein